MISRIVLGVAALALCITAVAAQDVIAERVALMKLQGAQTAQGAKFMKGEEPFDLAKAKNLFTVLAGTADKMPSVFPESSKNAESKALPALWEKYDDFKALAAKLGTDARAAAASVTDEASFKAAFPEVTKNCGGCHRLYRKPQS
jgi:cytochrome c556